MEFDFRFDISCRNPKALASGDAVDYPAFNVEFSAQQLVGFSNLSASQFFPDFARGYYGILL